MTLRGESMYPSIHLTIKERQEVTARVTFQNRVLCTAEDLLEAVAAVFASYYVFNVAYPQDPINTLSFLDYHVLGIDRELKIKCNTQRRINMLDRIA